MDSSELPSGPISVDSDALVAIDPDPADLRVPRDVVAVVNRQYSEARNKLAATRQRYEHHADEAIRERDQGFDTDAAREHEGKALRHHQDWTHTLGAVSALERLADELQVELDNDRRPYLRPEDRT